MRICKVDGCNKKHFGLGYCAKHHWQYKTYGKILKRTRYSPNEIIIKKNYAEIIIYDNQQKEKCRALISLNKIDFVKKHRWWVTNFGYIRGYQKNIKEEIFLHRLIINAKDDELVDHINRNKLDCRNENLRLCNKSQNSMNRDIPNNNTLGYTGVSTDKRKKNKKYRAYIKSNGKQISLGYYKTVKEAIDARIEGERKYFKEFAPI